MNIRYLGTAAFEGIPALFCDCPVCQRARREGGRAIRSRSQAIIDGELLLDFNADTFCHSQKYGIDFQNIRNCLVTHAHTDHLYGEDLSILGTGYAHPKEGYELHLYGSKTVIQNIMDRLEEGTLESKTLFLHVIKAFDVLKISKYTVTAFPAVHAPSSDPLFYQISDGEKTILYAHDTGYFSEDVWAYFEKEKPHFDLVSLDCTYGNYRKGRGGTHMGLGGNIEIKNKMMECSYADENTVFVCNHFSHNGRDVSYDDLVPIAAADGITVSFDGMLKEL